MGSHIGNVLLQDLTPVNYDDFANDHEGDWEHINVILNTQIPEKSSLESIQYYFHKKWTEIKKSTIIFADDSSHHPMVYIGGSGSGGNKAGSRYGDNSNSSYPYGYRVYYKIEHLRRVIIWDFDQDETVWSTSRGRVPYSSFTSNSDEPNDYRGLELLKDPSYLQSIDFYDNHDKYSWFNTNIRFGIPKSEVISPTILEHQPIDSKHGPAQNPGWKIVGSSSEFAPWEGWHEPIRLPH